MIEIPFWLLCAAILLGSIMTLWIVTRVRRRQLRGTLAAFKTFYLDEGRWVEGTIRYGRDDELQWFKDASLSPVPQVRIPRHLLTMTRHMIDQNCAYPSLPQPRGAREAQNRWVLIEFAQQGSEDSRIFAMGFEESAGVCAWAESWGSIGRGHWR